MKNLKFSLFLSIALINSISGNPGNDLLINNNNPNSTTCRNVILPSIRTLSAIGVSSTICLLTGPSVLSTLSIGAAGTAIFQQFKKFPVFVTVPTSVALAAGTDFADRIIASQLENSGSTGIAVAFGVAAFEFLLHDSLMKDENSAFAKWGNKMTNCFQRCWTRCKSRCIKADIQNITHREEQLSELESVQTQLKEKGLESVVLSMQGKFISLNESIESLKRDLDAKRKELDTYYDVIRTANIATPIRSDAAASSSQASSPESLDVEAARSDSRTPSPEMELRSPLTVPLLPSNNDD